MPIYEYECLDCGKQCEVIQKFDDEPLSSCPDCGGHMHKLISHTSFILKGTGWYVTDYARAEQKKSEKPARKTNTKPEQPKAEVSAKNS
ncbi:MAG: FmdB family transcriptional regulator [Thermodesulfovibrio sp. RBG_19FT_COMBO_42_12]|nr:MAG: FmdB family transcriptional regulator [Thermodesulfovibrio sp. RBG_19FT_COMBO_42_12]